MIYVATDPSTAVLPTSANDESGITASLTHCAQNSSSCIVYVVTDRGARPVTASVSNAASHAKSTANLEDESDDGEWITRVKLWHNVELYCTRRTVNHLNSKGFDVFGPRS